MTDLPPLPLRFLPAGDAALLVELPSLAHASALHRAVLAQPIDGVRDLVPAARTLLILLDPHNPRTNTSPTHPDLIHALHTRARTAFPANPAAPGTATLDTPTPAITAAAVNIPVHYNGQDLPTVAELLGTSVCEVIRRHTAQPWQAAFAGFAPGFVYLAGGHPGLQVPRRASPRTQVPAGSVALAGEFSAIYPQASPGGWQLIGTTGTPMWDLHRTPPALVQPGCSVQFHNAGATARTISLPTLPTPASSIPSTTPSTSTAPLAPNPAGVAIDILHPGLQTLVQDAGRPAMAALGISPSGALDTAAMRQANRLVGNPIHTPVLENLLGGLQLRCHGPVTLAVTGATTVLTLRDGSTHNTNTANTAPCDRNTTWHPPCHHPIALDAGDTLTLAAPTAGVRSYIAVRGGWGVEPVLGSCSTDTLAHIGPAALQPGQRLYTGHSVPAHHLHAVPHPIEPQPTTPETTPPRPALPCPGDTVTLDIIPGPRTDWFTPDALHLLTGQTWQVTPRCSRVGIRLQGQRPLERSITRELPSEGTVTGAIQVPADGQPLIFLADHPLTGGYPVIATIASHHLDLAAQIPAGCGVRLRLSGNTPASPALTAPPHRAP